MRHIAIKTAAAALGLSMLATPGWQKKTRRRKLLQTPIRLPKQTPGLRPFRRMSMPIDPAISTGLCPPSPKMPLFGPMAMLRSVMSRLKRSIR